MRFDEDVVEQALKYLGSPYIWAGKGDYCVRKVEGVDKVLPIATTGTDKGFDCSGLITWAVLKAGGPDLRGFWGAQAMWAALPLLDEDAGEDDDWFSLALYGTPKRATHVAIVLTPGARSLVLEAGGGDQRTLTMRDAMTVRDGAFVRVCFEKRKDFLGYRSLSALRKQRPKP